MTWLGSGREESPVERRIRSPRSWIRTSSSRSSITYVLKRNIWRKHIFEESRSNILVFPTWTSWPPIQPTNQLGQFSTWWQGSLQFVLTKDNCQSEFSISNQQSSVCHETVAWCERANLIKSEERLVPVLSSCLFGKNLKYILQFQMKLWYQSPPPLSRLS